MKLISQQREYCRNVLYTFIAQRLKIIMRFNIYVIAFVQTFKIFDHTIFGIFPVLDIFF